MSDTRAEIPYKKLTDQAININADELDYHHLKKIDACFDKFLSSCASCCCMNCERCCAALGECTSELCSLVANGLTHIAEGVTTAVISPTIRSIGHIVTGPDGNDNYELPKNITMIAGNPFLMLAELFARADGGCGIPFRPIVARAVECVDLLTSARQTQLEKGERFQRTMAGISALIFAGYAATYAMVLTDMIQNENQRQLDSLNPNPLALYDIVKELQLSTWNALQWSAASIGGYILTTNSYILGKELVLHKLIDGWKDLSTNIRVDAIQRHLVKLASIKNPDERLHEIEKFQVKLQNKEGLWHFTDVFGRALEQTVTMATYPLRAARDLASNLTSYKPVIGKLKAAKERAAKAYHNKFANKPSESGDIESGNNNEAKEEIKPVGHCEKITHSMFSCFYNKNAQKTDSDMSQSYEEILKQKQNEYYRVAPSTVLRGGVFSSAKETRLHKELVDHYQKAMQAYAKGHPIEGPFGVTGEAANMDWYKESLEDQQIQALLTKGFTEKLPAGTAVHTLAIEYNQLLHGYYNKSHQQENVRASAP